MTAVNPPVLNFSGGIIGGELQNRVDVQSYPNGAEVMTNFRPTLQGVMKRRPPMIHVDSIVSPLQVGAPIGLLLALTYSSEQGDPKVKLLPFSFSVDQSYLVETSINGFRFFADDGLITTPVVAASISATWTDQSTGAGSVTIVGPKLFLDSDGAGVASAQKIITTSNIGVVHVVQFEVVHGPVSIRIGSTSGATDVLEYTGLRAGFHLLAFTPQSSTSYLQFRHTSNAGRIVRDSVSILPGPDFTLTCPYSEAALFEVHTQQIRDVLYMVHNDYWPRRLERRGDRSWSIVKLLPDDGPFGDTNTTDTTLAASDTRGEVTLTASQSVFTADDEGVLYALTAGGQNKSATATTADVYTDGIKVTGIGSGSRSFTIDISGSFTATVRLQRSSGNENDYTNWRDYTTPQALSIYDAQDNQTWFYRLAVPPGSYTSGSITMTISYQGGSTTGICRVIQYTSPTSVIAEVIEGQNFATTSATRTWKRGDWNARDGFPSAITDGFARLWFGRGAKTWASKTDDFTSFEEGDEDDQSFAVQIATPSSDAVRWLAMLSHLVVGTAALEKVGLGNTTSDPIGPTNWQFLPGSEEGGAQVQPVIATGSVLYVHRSRKKLMQFTQNPKALSETSYISVDLNARNPEVLDADIVALAVQREPERRIFVVLASGRLCELLFRREGELDVVAWSVVETDGRVEGITVLPREDEDVVYLVVRRRDAFGLWQRFIERLGPERPLMDCDRYHLDSALGYELEKPNTVITPSSTVNTPGSGSGLLLGLPQAAAITVTADEPVFTAGDVGKVMWLNGGRGTITDVVSPSIVRLNVTSELDDIEPCPERQWGLRAPTSTLSGLGHREGQVVRVWGDMMDLGDYTVSGGSITLSQPVSVAYAGISTRSRWKSLKLAYGAQKGTALGMRKAIKAVIVLLHKTAAALRYGTSAGSQPKRAFSKLYPVPTRTPAVPFGEPVPLFSGESDRAADAQYDPDLRMVLEVDGPAPATISGLVLILDEKDR